MRSSYEKRAIHADGRALWVAVHTTELGAADGAERMFLAQILDISDQLDAKVAALRCYRSQLVDNQPAGVPGVIDSICDRTRFWGQMTGVRHAEPFASREPIGLASLEHLLP